MQFPEDNTFDAKHFGVNYPSIYL